MSARSEVRFRLAHPDDAEVIARLHADSRRRHYRGAFSDAYLDGDVVGDRLAVWTDRLADEDRSARSSPRTTDWSDLQTRTSTRTRQGALLDNLHVVASRKRQGIGTQLIRQTAQAITERPQLSGLYIWVLGQNTDGQAFYAALSGRRVGERLVSSPGGVAECLHGAPVALRYAWADMAPLLRGRTS